MGTEIGLRLAVVALAACIGVLGGCGSDNVQDAAQQAKAKADAGDLHSASVILKQAIQTQPDAWAMRIALADVLLRAGAAGAAQIELEKALELKAPKVQVIPKLAEAMVSAGAARALLEKHRSDDLGDPKANAVLKTWLAEAQLAMGDLAQATRQVDEALALDPQASRALLIRARMLAGNGDLDGAFRTVDAVLKDKPDFIAARHLKAELLWAGRGDKAGAEALLKDILVTHGDHVPTYSTLLSILAQDGRFDDYAAVLDGLKKHYAGTPVFYFFDTRLKLARRDLKNAAASAQELVRMAPDHALSLQLAGVVDLENGTPRIAELRLAKAVQLDPSLLVARQALGRIYLQRGQPRQALDVIRPALDGAGVDARSLAIAGEASMQLGDLERAAEWFTRASQLAPDDVLSKTALAVLAVGRQQRDAGLNQLRQLADTDRSAFADLALLNIRLRHGEIEEAFRITDRIATKLPGSPLAPLLKGRILLALGDAAGARKSFEAASSLRPGDYESSAALIHLDLSERMLPAARQRLDAMLKADPGNYRVHMLAAAVAQRSGAADDQVMGYLREAIRLGAGDPAPRVLTIEYLGSRNKFEQAKSAAQEAASAFPDDPQVMRALGGALAQTGDLQQAIVVLTRAVKLRPDDAAVQQALADAYLAKRDERAALSTLLAAVELIPESAALRARLIALSLRQSRVADAQRSARELQRRMPNLAAGWVLESELAEARKDYPAAISAALTALKKQDGASNAVRLYTLYAAAGRRPEGDRFAQGWLQGRPRDALFLRFMGEQALQQQNQAAAEDYFKRLVAINPRDPIALNNLAWATLKAGKPGALALSEQAIALLPGHPALLDTQAEALAAAGRGRDALEIRRRIVAADPTDAAMRIKLAKLLVAQDAKAEARSELESLLRARPEFQGRAQAEELLATLR